MKIIKIISLWAQLLASSFFIAILTHAFNQSLIPGILMGGIGFSGWYFFINMFNKNLAKDDYVARSFSQSAVLAGLATGVWMISDKDFTLWVWGVLFFGIGFWAWRCFDLSRSIEKAEAEALQAKKQTVVKEKEKVVEINFM